MEYLWGFVGGVGVTLFVQLQVFIFYVIRNNALRYNVSVSHTGAVNKE